MIVHTLVMHHSFEFYVGNIRRRFSSVPDNSCYAAASSDVLSPFAFLSGSTSCQVQDTIITPISSGFLPGQRILTVTTAPNGIGCYEIWTNTTHFLEQGNQRSESANFQAAASCPLCRNCATGSTCEGRCNVQGTLTCSDPCMCIYNLLIRLYFHTCPSADWNRTY